MATNIDHVKTVTKFVVGISTSFAVKRALKNNVPVDKRRHQAEVAVASIAVGGLVADSAEDWTDQQIDKIVEYWEKFKEALNGNT